MTHLSTICYGEAGTKITPSFGRRSLSRRLGSGFKRLFDTRELTSSHASRTTNFVSSMSSTKVDASSRLSFNPCDLAHPFDQGTSLLLALYQGGTQRACNQEEAASQSLKKEHQDKLNQVIIMVGITWDGMMSSSPWCRMSLTD